MNNLENKKSKEGKIVLWEGLQKELPWIIFWILVGMMAYGYYQDKQICDEVLADPCKVCYSLNQTLMNPESNYPSDPQSTYIDIPFNESIILFEDKNPKDRTKSDLIKQ